MQPDEAIAGELYSFLEKATGSDDSPANKGKPASSYSILDMIQGAHGEVYIVEKSPRKGDINDISVEKQENHTIDDSSSIYAVKRQVKGDRAARERKIFKELNSLYDSGKCPNFVRLLKAESSSGEEDSNDTNQKRESRERNKSGKEKDIDKGFELFVLEYAHKDLQKFRGQTLSPSAYRSILFQVLWALHIAQREFEFVHYDLHIRNIMLQPLHEQIKCLSYELEEVGEDGIQYTRWYPTDYLVKITDFGLSRMRIEEEVIFNPFNTMGETFTQKKDVEEVFKELKKLKVSFPPQMTEEQKSQWTNSLRLLRKFTNKRDVTPLLLLKHPFFDELKHVPDEISDQEMMRISSTGSGARTIAFSPLPNGLNEIPHSPSSFPSSSQEEAGPANEVVEKEECGRLAVIMRIDDNREDFVENSGSSQPLSDSENTAQDFTTEKMNIAENNSIEEELRVKGGKEEGEEEEEEVTIVQIRSGQTKPSKSLIANLVKPARGSNTNSYVEGEKMSEARLFQRLIELEIACATSWATSAPRNTRRRKCNNNTPSTTEINNNNNNVVQKEEEKRTVFDDHKTKNLKDCKQNKRKREEAKISRRKKPKSKKGPKRESRGLNISIVASKGVSTRRHPNSGNQKWFFKFCENNL